MAIAIVLIVGVAVTVGLIVGAIINHRRARLIEETPMCKVKELSSGLGKTQGRAIALAEDLLDSPMTNTPCLYFRFIVEEERQREVTEYRNEGNRRVRYRKIETYWAKIVDDVQHVPCGVKDKTGLAEVALHEAEMVLTSENKLSSGFLSGTPPKLQRLLKERYGKSTKVLFIFNKKMRYSEAILQEGDKVIVLGTVKKRKGLRPIFRKKDDPLIVSDKSDAELVKHYKVRRLLFGIGAAFAAVATVVGAVVVIINMAK